MHTQEMPPLTIMIKPRERNAIIKSLAAGVVPTIGLHHIQVDRKDEIMAMIGDLERIKEGGASFRLVIGRFGAGKSFFLNLAKTVALAEKFVVLQADFTQKHRLVSTTGYARNLYAALLGSMSTKARPEGGAVDVVLEKWASALREKYGVTFDAKAAVREELKQLQDMVGGFHFTQAMTEYCEARLSGNEDGLRSSKKWLMGGYDKVTAARGEIAIDSYIGDKDFYDYLKLWGMFVRIAGYSGLLILLDEMGALALANNATRTGNYEVILQILNDCLQGRASGVGFMLAGVDYFLDDPKNGLLSHGALASRLAPNPFARDGLKDFTTPIMRLGDFSPEDLYLLFENIREIFALGDKSKYLIPDEAIPSFMNLCAWSLGPDFYKTPRDAVKLFTGFLSVLEQNSHVDWRKLLNETVIESIRGDAETDPWQNDDISPLHVDTEEAGEIIIPTSEIHTEQIGTEEILADVFPVSELEYEAESLSFQEPDSAPAEPEPELERTALTPGFDSDAEKAGSDFEPPEPAAENNPQLGFEHTPGPGLYVVEAGPSLYDPDILYIMPDTGSPPETSLQLSEAEHPKETTVPAVPEALETSYLASLDETETLEEDMREGRILYGNDNDLKVFLPNLISRNPLIGMERISAGIHNDLVRMTRKILMNAHKNFLPNSYEKMLLTVALINIAKSFPYDDEDAFWGFISRQLGFEKDAFETIRSTAHSAIYETLSYYCRFFSKDSKTSRKDFYSTIMAHALSSRESMFDWFDFLMDFYRENLRGVIIINDLAVRGMTGVLRGIFEGAPDPGGIVLKGRRFALQTGIVTLLMKRPAYFNKLTREILMRIDRLASGLRLENCTYLDELLVCWFEKKSPTQITRAEPLARSSCPIAASHDAMRPLYEAEGTNSVVLVIPSMRVRERIRDCREAFVDIQCGDDHMREGLDMFGDEFGWTISETRIPLSRMSGLESARDLRIRVRILIEERIIYDSRTSLYRDIIIFRGEREIPANEVTVGLYSVFAPSETEIIFDPTADDRIIPAAAGQMRAVKFETGCRITVNGRIVCSDYRDETLRIIESSEPRPDLSFVLRGDVYGVWTGNLSVRVRIPSGRDISAYFLKAGDIMYPLNQCDMRNDCGVIECQLSVTGDMLTDHVFDVALMERGLYDRELYRRGFCVLNEINVAFDKPYYLGDIGGGTMSIELGTGKKEIGLGKEEYVFVPLGEGYIRAKVPIVSWRLEPPAAGIDSADGIKAVWKEDITADCKVIVTCPDGVACKLRIGESAVPSEQWGSETAFAAGAALNDESLGLKEDVVYAELILENTEANSSHILFLVYNRETFKEPPRFEMQDGHLILKNSWAFAGPGGVMLEYAFKGKTGKSYIVEAGERIISENCGLPHGRYDYRIFSLPEIELWRRKYVIAAGSCTLGDSNAFHFDNKLIEIRRVRSGFSEFFILPVYVENLNFVEMRAEYDDNVPYPMYSGTCYYLNRDDEKVYFREDFNPVLVAIINGRDICLYRKDGEKPYLIFESRHKLASSKPDENSGITYCIPDFFEYAVLDGDVNTISAN